MPITISRDLPVHKIGGSGWSIPGIGRIVQIDEKRVNAIVHMRDDKTAWEVTFRRDAIIHVEREVATVGERLLEAYADLVKQVKLEVEESGQALRAARERLDIALNSGAYAADWSVMSELHRAIAREKVAHQLALQIADVPTDREISKLVRTIVESNVMEYEPEQSTSKVSNLMGEITHVAWQRLRRMHALEYVIRYEQLFAEKGPDANATGW